MTKSKIIKDYNFYAKMLRVITKNNNNRLSLIWNIKDIMNFLEMEYNRLNKAENA